MDATSMREAALFSAARKLPVEQRAAYLEGACAGDILLRRQIEELLKADESAGEFLAQLAAKAGSPVRNDARLEPGTTQGATPGSPERPGDTIDRYQLMEQIGEGGCGIVYVAEQTKPVRRRVALKVIKLGMDTQQVVARFEAERQALAMMDHPNIAKVLDAGTTQTGRPYFVMELVRGIRITDYCDQANVPTRQRLELFIQVCQAIQHAHQKGIIHRDIKPSNILVTLHDGVPVPKVIDFGIAKATEGSLLDAAVYTQLHQFIGTPAYMSPEQAEMSGLDIDTRSDIYSLGVLLYELLVGSTPFDAQELMASGIEAMIKTIREQEPVRPSTKLATLPGESLTTTAKRRSVEAPRLVHLLRGDLDWIVMKCLEKDRTRRYETANGLAVDLRRHLNNEPVFARPPSAAYRFQKAFRRNKLVFTAAAAVATALVLGVAVSTWEMVAARKAQRETEVAHKGEQQQRVQAQSALKVAESEEQRAEEQARKATESQQLSERLLYVANMNLAQQAWEQNDIARVRQLLEATAAYPQRGFEWNYWQSQLHRELLTFTKHTEGIWSAAFSPDGVWVVTGGFDQTVKVWDAASGNLRLDLTGHLGAVTSASYSPDGKRIATGSYDKTVKVFDAIAGNILHTLNAHDGAVRSVVFSPDGHRLLTVGYDKLAKVWDADTGTELFTLQGHEGVVTSVLFSPDGERIFTGSWDGTVRVWNATDGKALFPSRWHDLGMVFSVAISKDGRHLLTGSSDQTARMWDTATGTELRTYRGHRETVRSVTFSADGGRIATGSDDNTARIWDAATGKTLLTIRGHTGFAAAVAFAPDGHRLVSGSFDGTAKVWNADPGRDPLTFEGHRAPVRAVAFSRDGQRLATAGFDGTAKVWDAASAREHLTLTGEWRLHKTCLPETRNFAAVITFEMIAEFATGSNQARIPVFLAFDRAGLATSRTIRHQIRG